MEQLRDTIKSLNGEVSGEKPHAVEAPVMETLHRVHLIVEAFRGVGEGQKGNGYMDEVTEELVSKRPHVFLEAADEKRAGRQALHHAIYDAVASGLPLECVDHLKTAVMKSTHENVFRRAWMETHLRMLSQCMRP